MPKQVIDPALWFLVIEAFCKTHKISFTMDVGDGGVLIDNELIDMIDIPDWELMIYSDPNGTEIILKDYDFVYDTKRISTHVLEDPDLDIDKFIIREIFKWSSYAAMNPGYIEETFNEF